MQFEQTNRYATKLYRSEHNIWWGIVKRCTKPYDTSYKSYGAKGIKICDRWLESFDNFMDDMGKRPSGEHSIDRIDTYGDYEPSNCRWATNYVQYRNKKNNSYYIFRGEKVIISDIARALNINQQTLEERLKRGWSEDRTFNTPVMKQFSHTRAVSLKEGA